MMNQSSAPLLSDYQDEQNSGSWGCRVCRPSVSMVFEEMKKLYTLALPIIFTSILIYGKTLVSSFYMGKLGKDDLAGGSLAMGIANISGYSVIYGLSIGMDGICSQAFGAKKWSLVGKTLQRTIVILLPCCLFISSLWFIIESVLLILHQDPVVSSIASTYLRFAIPDLFLWSIISPLRIYFRTQHIIFPIMLSAGFALGVHVITAHLFVNVLSYGIRSIAVAVVITDFTFVMCMVFYLYFSRSCEKSWQGWSLECFKELRPILALAMPSCLAVCLEWWWYEIIIFSSGYLSKEAVATMGIIIQATAFVYIFPSSLSQAVSTRVGNELGANSAIEARNSTIVALSCAFLMSLIAATLMITMRNIFGHVFTDDSAILSLTAMSLPILGICEIGNGLQTTGCGAFRGCARPSLGAFINAVSFYLIGLHIAFILGFEVKMGLRGFWLGLIAAQVVCAALTVLFLARIDWMEQAERAVKLTASRVENSPLHA